MTLSTDNRFFVSGAMCYLILSAAWLAWQGALITSGALRMAGVHLFAVGFVLSLLYGLGAHMLPRFTGSPIAMGVWPWLQFAALNAGLVGFLAGAAVSAPGAALAGGALIWLSLAIFAGRLWRVLWPRVQS